jgi:two-component system cell cycle response regulator DivK
MAKARILIVEDNPDNLELMRFLLDHAGYEVKCITTGLKALEAAHQDLPDLIILDLGLPELDGWTLAKTLKSDPSTRHIPVVAVTAYTLSADHRRAMAAGCDGFIGKPMDVKTFVQDIEQFLKKDLLSDNGTGQPPQS